MPVFAGVELIAENVGRFVRLGLKGLIVGVHSIVGVAIDDADERTAAWIVCWKHYVEVDLAVFALDVHLYDALDFKVSALDTVFG